MSTSVPAPAQGTGIIAPTVDLYHPATDLNTALSPEQREELKQNQLTSFSTPGAIILNIITLGLFGTIYYGLKSDALPKVKPDDPSGGKFIGFSFIPLFNIYWFFVAWPRLMDRINFQYRLRGQPAPIDRGRFVTAALLSYFGWFFLIGGIIGIVMLLQLQAQTQNAMNRLAAERGA
ncbi:MAG TPA: hypothetical protein VGY32_11225 [Solirubrobacteraceae bacterium]|nr:hypothetical protein [Solirubrobacteraceae bacterium]